MPALVYPGDGRESVADEATAEPGSRAWVYMLTTTEVQNSGGRINRLSEWTSQ